MFNSKVIENLGWKQRNNPTEWKVANDRSSQPITLFLSNVGNVDNPVYQCKLGEFAGRSCGIGTIRNPANYKRKYKKEEREWIQENNISREVYRAYRNDMKSSIDEYAKLEARNKAIMDCYSFMSNNEICTDKECVNDPTKTTIKDLQKFLSICDIDN